MEVFHDISEVPKSEQRLSVAIGNFDGLHKGHQALIQSIVESAARLGTRPAVFTFYPHPVEVLRPETQLRRLMTTQEKLAALERLGVQVCVVQAFDGDLAKLSAEGFFREYLCDGMSAASIVVGENFHFGSKRSGDSTLLKALCAGAGVEFHAHPPVEVKGIKVSSTLIRNCLLEGKVEDAAAFLGASYRLEGRVVRGNGNGSQLGFPTANVRPPEEKIVPAIGVYLARLYWQKESFVALVNIGQRPSLADDGRVVIEAHIPDFQFDLYDETVELEFLERLRDEKKFDSVDALKHQISLDVKSGKDLYNQKFSQPD